MAKKKKTKKPKGKKKKGVLGKLAEKALFVPLLPLKGAMIAGLKKKTGVNYKGKSFKTVLTAFHDMIAKNKGHLEDYSHLEFLDEELGITENHVVSLAIDKIIDAVIGYFKGLKTKKEKGEPLSPTDETVLKVGETAEVAIKESAIKEAKFAVGDFAAKYGIIIIGALVVLFLILRKK